MIFEWPTHFLGGRNSWQMGGYVMRTFIDLVKQMLFDGSELKQGEHGGSKGSKMMMMVMMKMLTSRQDLKQICYKPHRNNDWCLYSPMELRLRRVPKPVFVSTKIQK